MSKRDTPAVAPETSIGPFKVPAETHDGLRKLAADNDRTLAAEVRRALRSHVEREATA